MAAPLDDAPSPLIERAHDSVRAERRAAEHDEQGRRLARRLMTAFAIVAVLAVVFFVVLPHFVGVAIPPLVPLMAFGVILAAAVLNHEAETPEEARHAPARPEADDGRPVGCCPGPRTLRCFRDR